MPSLRCVKVNQTQNGEALMLKLDMLEEKRERAAIHETNSKARMEKYCNAKDRNTIFKPGDFMYRNNKSSQAKEGKKLVQTGKDRMKWLKHLEMEHTRSGLKVEALMMYFSFGGHLEELHMTWAHLEKKRTRLQTYTNISQDYVLSSWRRRHSFNVTPSQRIP
ncbi:hypothetical protein Tco_0090177 [Tanacetum coccineum]